MRNVWRVLAFDIVGPLVAIAALLMIGVFLGWPLWWVSAVLDAVPAGRPVGDRELRSDAA